MGKLLPIVYSAIQPLEAASVLNKISSVRFNIEYSNSGGVTRSAQPRSSRCRIDSDAPRRGAEPGARAGGRRLQDAIAGSLRGSAREAGGLARLARASCALSKDRGGGGGGGGD